MGHEHAVRQLIPEPYCGDKIQPQEGQVGEIVLIERFVLQVGMDKPEAAQRPSSYRIIGKIGDEYPLCISCDDMSDRPGAVNQQAYLAAYL
jgi:hypothetical protein